MRLRTVRRPGTLWNGRCGLPAAGRREGILDPPREPHGDNGSPLKGATVQALLGRLGITALFSRPRVSDDNARSLSRAQSRGRGPVSRLEVLTGLSTPGLCHIGSGA